MQYRLDGPETMTAQISANIDIRTFGRQINIFDNQPWELYSTRNIKIYNIQGQLLQTITSNGILQHQWQAPVSGLYILRLNTFNGKAQVKRIIVQ